MTLKELKKRGLSPIEIWKVVLKSPDLQDEYQKEYHEWNLEQAQKLVAFCSQLKSEKNQERYEAIMLLNRMSVLESVPELAEVLKDSDRTIRQMALDALYRICNKKDVLQTLEAMEEEYPSFVIFAKQVLYTLKNQAVHPNPEFFSFFFGDCWRIVKENELRYEVEVTNSTIKEKQVYQFNKNQDIFLL